MKIAPTLALLCLTVGTIEAFHLHHRNISQLISSNADDLKSFTLQESITGAFYTQGLSASWLDEDLFYNNGGIYVKYNVETREEIPIFNMDLVAGTPVNSVTLSPDSKYVLFGYDRRQVFRHSATYKFFIINIETEERQEIADGDDLQICRWAENAAEPQLIYVKGNDVYIWKTDLNLRVTDTGVPGVIYNGVTDWVYEEEIFGSEKAFWVSPNANRLAFATFNDVKVEKFQFDMFGVPGDLADQYPEHVKIRYPKPGSTNPTVALTVVDLSMNKFNVPAPIDKVSDDHILGAVAWMSDEVLAVSWLNRRQQIASIQRCNIISSTCEEVVSINILNGWIETFDLYCPIGAGKCLYMDNFENWRQIFSFELEGPAIMETSGDHIANYVGYDTATSEVYYTAVADNDPQGRHVYRGTKCLSCDVITPENNKCTFASGTFSKAFSYYSLTCNGPDPSFTRLYRSETDEELYVWQNNDATRAKLTEYQTINTVYIRVPVEGGFSAAVKLQFPSDIDLANPNPDVKYPMIVHVYAGPNSVSVQDSFSVGFQNYLITDRKIIYAEIDGRGSGNKGIDMLFAVNDKLGNFEIVDQITVTQNLLETYTFIDAERTGIWGWSYGGYSTSMALARDSEFVFKCGVAVAPVTNWMYYDTMYTERYMGTPQTNAEGYTDGDVTHRAQGIAGHKLLLVHGNADDNVHFQHAMALSRALQLAEVPFEQMSYPDENHSLGGVSSHLYNTMSDFWDRCFE